jgi:hypothetical protein
MSMLFDILREDSRALAVKQFPDCESFETCWYPSSGSDFRHINYLETKRLYAPALRPILYVHSDMLLGDLTANKRDADMPFTPDIFDGLKVQDCFEVFTKEKFFSPSTAVWYLGSGGQFSGRVFLLRLCLSRPNGERTLIPLLYFGYENLNLLVDCFLANRVKLERLVHIRDGGASFGGSWFPMNFIYETAHLLGLQRVITDVSVHEKRFDHSHERQLRALRIRCRRNRMSRSAIDQIGHDSAERFRDLCREKVIPLEVYGLAEHADAKIYDWEMISL